MSRARAFFTAASIVAATLLLTSCVPSGSVEQLASVDADSMTLPDVYADRAVVDPDWLVRGHMLDGIAVGPRERNRELEFIAVDARGDVLWSETRPLSCTGFALTRTDTGQALAVLTDVNVTEQAIAGTSATAYDLETGGVVWGPVEVPGPLLGPGLVFAATPAAAIGEIGAKVALDPSTGRVIASETDRWIAAEHRGVVLWNDEQTHHRGHTLPADAPLVALPGEESELSDVVDVGTGNSVATGVKEQRYDTESGILVVNDGTTVMALRDGDPLWRASPVPPVSVVGIDTRAVYVRTDEQLVALALDSGRARDAFARAPLGTQQSVFVPVQGHSDGSTIVERGDKQLIVIVDDRH